ncbi:MAG TPA: orotidine-5'-phosphate decarboxylase [Rhizomicrobium sp.]|jgi:orotidine-5'-phosphate decarboxylase|nr:orotidine-5'-phosphate decarboxylase [Rhizomicrobium sp.]
MSAASAGPHAGPAPPKTGPSLRDRLIVALDVPNVEAADRIVEKLGERVGFYKIGLQLQFAAAGSGLQYADRLIKQGKSVFLDSKLFDIPETVELAVQNIARMGARFLTIHGTGKTIAAAVRGRGAADLQILSVTVLTSLDAGDLQDMGFAGVGVSELVLHRAKKALEAGADGVIASGEEVEMIRQLAANKLKIVTPGIRRSADPRHDQKRIATPAQAIAAGADHLVVGRPITQAADPQRAAEEILQEIAGAL